jgi:hypothetical protein
MMGAKSSEKGSRKHPSCWKNTLTQALGAFGGDLYRTIPSRSTIDFLLNIESSALRTSRRIEVHPSSALLHGRSFANDSDVEIAVWKGYFKSTGRH